MAHETTRKFIGRAIVIDPETGKDSAYSAYVCVLLTGTAGVPSVTVCQARTADELLANLRTNDLYLKFAGVKLTFEPPKLAYPVSHSSARQRYEALSYDELNRAQTILSGR